MADEPTKLDISDEMIAERRGVSSKMPNDMPLWMAKSIISIDKFSKIIGNIVCWILMPLIFAMTYEVIMRKLFLAPTIWAYDCLLYTSPSPRDRQKSRMPSSA